MRKAIYTFYNLLASYTVIILILITTTGIVYLSTGYRPIEKRYGKLLEKRIEIKREQQRLASELESMRQGDLHKRLKIFSDKFINESDINNEKLLEIPQLAFSTYRWKLLSSEVIEQDITDNSLGLGLVTVAYQAVSKDATNSSDETFLPVNFLIKASTYLWRTPPIKDFTSIRIERKNEGYLAKINMIYPVDRKDDNIRVNE